MIKYEDKLNNSVELRDFFETFIISKTYSIASYKSATTLVVYSFENIIINMSMF